MTSATGASVSAGEQAQRGNAARRCTPTPPQSAGRAKDEARSMPWCICGVNPDGRSTDRQRMELETCSRHARENGATSCGERSARARAGRKRARRACATTSTAAQLQGENKRYVRSTLEDIHAGACRGCTAKMQKDTKNFTSCRRSLSADHRDPYRNSDSRWPMGTIWAPIRFLARYQYQLSYRRLPPNLRNLDGESTPMKSDDVLAASHHSMARGSGPVWPDADPPFSA